MKKFSIILALFFLVIASPSTAQKLSKDEINTKGAYYTGKYRNLFVEDGHSKKEIKAKNEAAFRQLFHGDSATQRVYFEVGRNENGPLAYISDVNHNDIRSEGMSYGMMIAVQMDRKAEFDALWNYSMTYMYINNPAHPSDGYFSWSLKRNGQPNSETPAPDGEEYWVMALYFAANRWGNGTGIYNYKEWADKVLTAIVHHPLKTGMTKFGNRAVHNMVNEEAKMIRFVPNTDSWGWSDPSYHLPAFYELWAKWGPEPDRKFWTDAADTSRSFFQKTTNPVTGLAPDYANFDGTPFSRGFNTRSANFSYDARRTQMNWSVDWSWWAKDPREKDLSNKIQAFFKSQGIDTYGCQFTLDGKPLDKNHAKGLVATNAVTSLSATGPYVKEFTEALWNTPVPSALGERYYEGLLYMMAMLHCSGEFRIWKP
jgi:oligosaccharide reducing-end xylanase